MRLEPQKKTTINILKADKMKKRLKPKNLIFKKNKTRPEHFVC